MTKKPQPDPRTALGRTAIRQQFLREMLPTESEMLELAERHGSQVRKDALDHSIRTDNAMYRFLKPFGPPLSDICRIRPETTSRRVVEADLQASVAKTAYLTAATEIRMIVEGDFRPLKLRPDESKEEELSRIHKLCAPLIQRVSQRKCEDRI